MKTKFIIFAVIIIALAGVGYKLVISKQATKILSPEEAWVQTENFINKNLMAPGSKATVKEVTEEGGLYKLVVDVGTGQDIDSYLTKDGKLFFPQAIDIAEAEKEISEQNNTSQNTPQNTPPASNVSVKQDKPSIELFVMSHCPYGTQTEKGILPVVEVLGDKIDFEIKFVDYAMHGQTEIDEQMQQYCVQQQGKDKILSYLKSFLQDSDSDKAMTASGADISQVQSCISATDSQYKITANYNDQSTYRGSYPTFDIYKEDNLKYGVAGSPTLVINGEKIASARDSSSLLATICSGFNDRPEQCNTQLSSVAPSPGFGTGTASPGGNSGAMCN